MNNRRISELFRRIAQILMIKGDNPFRIRAYERAAQNIDSLTEDIAVLMAEGKLTSLSGIGKDLADKIKELITTGKIHLYEELAKSIPEGVLELLAIPGVGPKTAQVLFKELKITSVADLETAIRKKRLQGIPGIKAKTVENLMGGIALLKRGKERMPLSRAIEVGEDFLFRLRHSVGAKKISLAGSLRRHKETVRDIDILVVSSRPEAVMDAFVKGERVARVLAEGQTKSSIRTKDDVQVDCRVVSEESFGAALLYFTGSK